MKNTLKKYKYTIHELVRDAHLQGGGGGHSCNMILKIFQLCNC